MEQAHRDASSACCPGTRLPKPIVPRLVKQKYEPGGWETEYLLMEGINEADRGGRTFKHAPFLEPVEEHGSAADVDEDDD